MAAKPPFWDPLVNSWLGFVALGALAYFLAECVLGPEAYERFQERPQRIAVAGGAALSILLMGCGQSTPVALPPTTTTALPPTVLPKPGPVLLPPMEHAVLHGRRRWL